MVAVYSLEKTTLGHCVFSKKFGEIFNFSSIFSVTRYAEAVGLSSDREVWVLVLLGTFTKSLCASIERFRSQGQHPCKFIGTKRSVYI